MCSASRGCVPCCQLLQIAFGELSCAEIAFTPPLQPLQIKNKLIATSKYTVEDILQKQKEKNKPQATQLEEVVEASDDDSDYEQPECAFTFFLERAMLS